MRMTGRFAPDLTCGRGWFLGPLWQAARTNYSGSPVASATCLQVSAASISPPPCS